MNPEKVIYALDFDNKITTYKNYDTFLFCSRIQVQRKYPNLYNKIVTATIEVTEQIEDYENSITDYEGTVRELFKPSQTSIDKFV